MPKGTSLSDEGGVKFYSLKDRPILATWQGMEACVKAGLCRGIGVSNFSVKKLKELLPKCTIPPAINQVECHPYFQQGALLQYCQSKKIHLTCYSPLGSLDRPAQFIAPDEPRVLDDPTLHAIATSLGAKPAQVILKWAMQRGTSTIPKSVHPGRMKENLAAATALVDLEPDAMQVIADLDRNLRLIDGTFWTTPEGSPYTLENLWDEDE
jgi:alcohol dehydrogenase (NADP+)